MTIEHRNIPDAQLHEPKGVAGASAGTVYIADGLGSGDWDEVSSASLKDLSGDSGSSNFRLVTNGTNGFRLASDNVYGVMGISNNGSNFAVTAAADPTLNTTTDYVLFTGTGAGWGFETNFGGTTFLTDRITVPVAGVYEIRSWGNVSGFPNINAAVGVKFRINGVTWSPRTAIVKSNASGDFGNVNAFGFATLAANDYVQLYVASTHSGNLVIRDINVTVELKRAT